MKRDLILFGHHLRPFASGSMWSRFAVATGLLASLMASSAYAGPNPDGSYSYSIPIKIPQGRTGMQPAISVDYSSNAANGELGVGWRVSGLRAITRGGQNGGVPLYDGTDLYYLDGQKLVSDGAGQYRTKNESWQKIIPSGSCGDGPCSFSVTGTDGTVTTFGGTTDSRIEAVDKGASVRVWALSGVQDLNGNSYEVTYTEDTANGDYVPSVISYTKPNAVYHTITFNWQTRSDVEESYISGVLVKSDQRLANIEIRSGSALQRKYVFTYDNAGASGRSRLLSVKECGTDGTTCFPAQTFGWQEQPASFTQLNGLVDKSPNGGLTSANVYPIITGDWDGDGRTDWGRVESQGIRFYRSTDSGWKYYAYVEGWAPSTGFTDANVYPIYTGDWNGDGKTDWGRIQDGAASFFESVDKLPENPRDGRKCDPRACDPIPGFIHLKASSILNYGPNGGFTNASAYPIITGDWDGDGKTDWGRVENQGIHFYRLVDGNWADYAYIAGWGQENGFTDSNVYPIFTGDWNGDGKMDWGRVQNAGVTFFLSTGSGFTKSVTISGWGPNSGFTNANTYPVYVGDWNGDGKTDWGRVQYIGATFFLSTGNGFSESVTINGWGPSNGFTDANTYPVYVGDWNGDGKTDWGRVQYTGATFFLSTGNGFSESVTISGWGPGGDFTDSDTYPIYTGDWNGDGKIDWGRVRWAEASYFVKTEAADLVTSISNGLGGVTNITYQASIGHAGAINLNAAYPTPADNSLRQLVVQERTSLNGSTYATTYQYSDGRLFQSENWEDPHSLGFAWIKATDTGTGIYSITYYSQGPATGDDIRLAGVVKSSETLDSAGNLWSRTVNTYEIAGPAPYAGQAIAARLKQTETYSYNGGVLFNKKKTVNSFNADGKVTSVESYSGAADTLNSTATTIYGKACAGSLIAAIPTQITVTGADGTARTTVTTYNTTCDVETTTSAGLTTTYAYDAFGNVTSVTDPRGAVATTTYDGGIGAFANTLAGHVTVSGAGITSRTSVTLYDDYGRPTETRDPNYAATGLSAVTTYDVLHRPLNVSVGGIVRTKNTYPSWTETRTETLREDGTWNASLVTTDALGRTIQEKTQYDDGTTVKWLLSCTDYDAQGRAYRKSTPAFDSCSSNYVTTTYDPLGRVSGITYSDGRPTVTYLYNGLTTTVRTGADATHDVVTTLDSRERVITKTEPESATVTYSYNDQNQVISVQAAGGNALTIGYDEYGRKTTVNDANISSSTTLTYAYNAQGDLASTVDAKGNVIIYEYDVLGRATKKCYGTLCTAGNAVTTIYDTAPIAGSTLTMIGAVAEVSSPAFGKEVAWSQAFAYDAKGRAETSSLTIDGQAYLTTTTYYDTTDTPRCVALPDGSVTRNTYTASGKNLKQVDYFDYTVGGTCPPNGSGSPTHSIVYSDYTAEGKVGKVQYYSAGTLTNTSNYTYTPWGGLSAVNSAQGSAGTALENLSYSYTPYLELSKIDDALKAVYAGVNTDRTQAFRYDNQGRLIEAAAGTGADCTATSCTAGNLWGGATKVYAFDVIGNLTKKDGLNQTYSATYGQRLANFGGSGHSYSHDDNGSVTVKKDGTTWWRYTYNRNLMMTQAEKSIDSGENYVVIEKNTYIGELRIKKDYMPDDPAARVQTYYVGGAFEVRNLPDGTRLHTVYVVGPAGRVASLTRNAGASPAYLAAVQSYTHYGLARLSDASVQGVWKSVQHRFLGFAYSEVGKIVLAWICALTAMVLLLTIGIWMMALIRAIFARERRNVFALRIPRYSALISIALLACQGFFAACSSGTGYSPNAGLVAATVGFTNDGHTIASIKEALTGGTSSGPPPGSYFMLNNHIGSNAVIVHAVNNCENCQGTHASTVNYYPYGEINSANSTGQDLVTYKFTGQELDAETGLYNFGARMYDSTTGRFLTPDSHIPEGGWDSQGLNRYMYVRGNPISFTDPLGHSWKDNRAKQAAKKAARNAVRPDSARGQKLQQALEDANGAAAWLARYNQQQQQQKASLNSTLNNSGGTNPFTGTVQVSTVTPGTGVIGGGCMSEACIVGSGNYGSGAGGSKVTTFTDYYMPQWQYVTMRIGSIVVGTIGGLIEGNAIGAANTMYGSDIKPEDAPLNPLMDEITNSSGYGGTTYEKQLKTVHEDFEIGYKVGGIIETVRDYASQVKDAAELLKTPKLPNIVKTIVSTAKKVATLNYDVENGKASNFNIITGHWETKIKGTWTYWNKDHWQQMGPNDDGWGDKLPCFLGGCK